MCDVNISTKRDFGIPRILYHLARLFDNTIKRDDVQVNIWETTALILKQTKIPDN